ncbi:DUF4124 domain-containing protein [Microbulbifer flavimaris]|uniref:DUF4124 domain-containing protein n=1 Tax=Microbulbifer flavimaris TaxID=1781068 RepID=A0ABX4I0V1_9GAMM|nr:MULTISPECIES: DUF4124 domain-containing protein [Microbulbifer]KUJ83836.1 hypothetical protein AVO43_08425 [Microbulbifer sp. ZGT114]PCO06014.1 DUF4124 domain-containing protein [Microbulbifer flavimaris]
MIRTVLLALTVAAASAATVADELYRWVDEDGRVHFGDRPPVSAEAEDVGGELTPINSADATQAAATPRKRETSSDLERQYRQRQKQRLQRQQSQRAEACRQAKRNLRILRGPVIVLDQNGREVRLSERERQQRAAALEQQIQQLCG